MTQMRPFRVRAHAKINLLLRVGAVQADGYHPLQTVFQSLALHDTLEVTPRSGPFELTCSDAGLPVDGRNLVTRAARELWAALGRPGEPHGVSIHLAKHIPMQAGLGGGSSDAAAALAALAACWRRRGVRSDLASIAARLGADVAYFLVGGTALGLGRGDELYPLADLPPFSVVLALPGFGVPTADAYRWFDEDGPLGARHRDRGGSSHGSRHRDRGFVEAWPGLRLELGNELEAPVARRHPGIAAIRKVLTTSGAVAAAMTGSGSAVFGLFETEARARRAARAVAEAGDAAILTRTVTRSHCRRALGLPADRRT